MAILGTPFWASSVRSHFGMSGVGWLSELAPNSASVLRPASGNLPGVVPWATANSGGRLADNNRWRWISSFSGARWTVGLVRISQPNIDQSSWNGFYDNSSADAVHGLVSCTKGAKTSNTGRYDFTYTIRPTDTSGPYATVTVEIRSRPVGTGTAYYFNRFVVNAAAGDSMWKFVPGTSTDLNTSTDPMSGWVNAGYSAQDLGTSSSGGYAYMLVYKRNT